MIRADRHTYKVFNQDFTIDKRFQITKELGHGAYGIVCAARCPSSPEIPGVAIKKVTNIFSKKILCKRALRELRLLKHFRGHRNITCLYDMDIVDTNNFNELYLYEELMECDMHQIIRSQQPLTDLHHQSFIHQILVGLKYIHSANVLHRDLKPGNLLVNADCELKICDFGLARGFSNDPEQNAGYLTEYVATRWYRAPEIMLSFQSYTKAIDVWSVGCILAELLGGKPFFKGRDYVDQLNQILRTLGTPPEATLRRIGSPRAQEYVRSLPVTKPIPFNQLFPNANPEALDLLGKMLAFDPVDRITVEDALAHPFLKIWHDPADEPVCAAEFDFSFESVDSIDEMRQMILDEVINFRDMVRRPEGAQQIQDQVDQTWQPTELDAAEQAQLERECSEQLNKAQQQQQQEVSQNMAAASEYLYDTASQQQQQQQRQQSQSVTGTANGLFSPNTCSSQQTPLGIPSREFRFEDEQPPKPQESIRGHVGTTGVGEGECPDLERELEFGLDGR